MLVDLVEWAHGGPANARVEDVEIRNEKFTGEFQNLMFCINEFLHKLL